MFLFETLCIYRKSVFREVLLSYLKGAEGVSELNYRESFSLIFADILLCSFSGYDVKKG